MTTVRELVTKLSTQGTGTEDLKKFSESGDKASNSATELNSALEIAKKGFAVLQGAVSLARDAFDFFVSDVARFGDETKKLSRNIGISGETMQELGFAAGIAGSDTATLGKGIQSLGRNLNDARAKGSGPFVDAIEDMGFALEDFDGLKPDEAFEKFADEIAKIEDPIKKGANAQALMGRAGKTLIPLLDEGGDGIRRLREEARELGGVMGEDALEAAEQYTDAQLRLTTTLDGFKNQIGAELLPIVTEIIDATREWAFENGDAVKEELIEFLRQMIAAARDLGPTMLDLLEIGRDFLLWLVEVIQETQFLFTHLDELDQKLTDDFGPAWALVKQAIENVIAPIRIMIGLIQEAANAVGIFSDEADVITTKVRGLGSAESQVQVAKGPGGGGALATARGAELNRVNLTRTAADLKRIANDPKASGAARAKAATLLPQRAARDQIAKEGIAFAKNMTKLAERAKRAARDKAARAASRSRTGKSGARLKKGGKGKAADKVTDEELLKLIEDAAPGTDLSSLTAGRTLPKVTSPVVTVAVNQQNVQMDLTMDVDVNGVPGTSAEAVAKLTIERVREALGAEVRGALETLTPVESS